MQIGIIGSGDVARSLGVGFVTTGHRVQLGSRHPDAEPLRAWRARVGDAGSIGTFAEAGDFGDLLVLATHGVHNPEAIEATGRARFDGKVLIDVTNPLEFDAAGRPKLAIGGTDSAGERVQRLLPRARVVKAFNTVGHALMFRPKLPGGPPDMFLCGNDPSAKAEVEEILHTFGWTPIDVGGIEGARMLESLCQLWLIAARQVGSWDVAFRLLRR